MNGKFIKVNEFQETSAPNIYALGDVTGEKMLTPVALRAGRILAERLYNNKPHLKMDYQNIATVVFTHPPVGAVGLNEREAKNKFGEENVKIYSSEFTNMFYSLSSDNKHRQSSLLKTVCHIDASGVE